MQSVLNGLYWVPESVCGNYEMHARALTVKPKNFKKNEPDPPPLCLVQKDGQYVGLPIWHGMCEYPDPNYLNQCSQGAGALDIARLPDPHHPKASPDQPAFQAALDAHFAEYHVGLARAGTGTGKTVCALSVAGKRGRKTLVITDRTYLSFKQWVPEAKLHLGLADNQIGIVQENKCEYDKQFVVAVAKSLTLRDYPPDFYTAFGTVIFDELHKFGAQTLCRVLPMFNPEILIGLTATKERKDGAHRIYMQHFGNGQLEAKGKALKCYIEVLQYHGEEDTLGSNLGLTAKLIGLQKGRNKLIVDKLLQWYRQGHPTIVMGDNIQHLQRIEFLCKKAGVNPNHMGQFTRDRYYMDERPDVDARTGQPILVQRMHKAKVTDEYLAWVKEHAKIIFATFSMAKEGVDIPRLSRGIDISPRSDAEQAIGRIRRPLPGKVTPVWATIDDVNQPFLRALYKRRIEDMIKSGAEYLR